MSLFWDVQWTLHKKSAETFQKYRVENKSCKLSCILNTWIFVGGGHIFETSEKNCAIGLHIFLTNNEKITKDYLDFLAEGRTFLPTSILILKMYIDYKRPLIHHAWIYTNSKVKLHWIGRNFYNWKTRMKTRKNIS